MRRESEEVRIRTSGLERESVKKGHREVPHLAVPSLLLGRTEATEKC